MAGNSIKSGQTRRWIFPHFQSLRDNKSKHCRYWQKRILFAVFVVFVPVDGSCIPLCIPGPCNINEVEKVKSGMNGKKQKKEKYLTATFAEEKGGNCDLTGAYDGILYKTTIRGPLRLLNKQRCLDESNRFSIDFEKKTYYRSDLVMFWCPVEEQPLEHPWA